MGFIRGFFLVFAATLLFLSMFSGVFLLTVSSSLQYQTLEKESKTIVKDFLFQQMNISSAIDNALPFMQIYCQTNQEYTINEVGYSFSIPCTEIAKGKDAMIDASISSLINNIYYKNYECEFTKCFSQEEIPLFLFSKKSHDFFYNIFIISLLVSLVLLTITFFLTTKKSSFPILAGILLVFSSLPFLKIKNLLNIIPNSTIASLAGLFFSSSQKLSLILVVAGAVLIAVGVVLKLLKIGNEDDKTKPKITKSK